MKKLLAHIIVLSLVFFLLSACGGNGGNNTPPAESIEPGFKITDYYNEDGSFSALGLALDEVNGEKTLTVKSGDTLIVGGDKYRVTVQSLALPFYTQSSLDAVIEWWVDYCESRIERGEMD